MSKVANTIVFDRNSRLLNVVRPVGTQKVRRRTYTGRYAISTTFGFGITSFPKKPKNRLRQKRFRQSALRIAQLPQYASEAEIRPQVLTCPARNHRESTPCKKQTSPIS